jgi:hypothetical protein
MLRWQRLDVWSELGRDGRGSPLDRLDTITADDFKPVARPAIATSSNNPQN